MLRIQIGEDEMFNEETNEFSYSKPFELKLEHSLLSISKWESIWRKPFLQTINRNGDEGKTLAETISYIKCMTIIQNVPDSVYDKITNQDLKTINEYINQEATATWFAESKNNTGSDKTIVTSELIYYWMNVYQIPWEAQKWHLSRLFTLIQIHNVKSESKKKMSKTEVMRRNSNINEARKRANQSRG